MDDISSILVQRRAQEFESAFPFGVESSIVTINLTIIVDSFA